MLSESLVPLGNGIHDQPEKEEYPEADPEANGPSKHHALQLTAGIAAPVVLYACRLDSP
jgi:hypothetical protein